MFLISLLVNGDRPPFCFDFGYFPFFVGEISSFVYFCFCHVFFHFSFSDIPYSCFLSSFFNLPAPGLRGSSDTERNFSPCLLYIWKIWRSRDRQRWFCQAPPFPFPYMMGAGKGSIYVCLSVLYPFLQLERNEIFLQNYVCSLSRLWVGREILWICSHNVSLVKFSRR